MTQPQAGKTSRCARCGIDIEWHVGTQSWVKVGDPSHFICEDDDPSREFHQPVK